MAIRTGSMFDVGRTFKRPRPKNLERLSFERQARRTAAPQDVIIKAGWGHPFRNVPLTVYLEVSTPKGDRFVRAADLLAEDRFNSKAPAVAKADVRVFEIVTQGGHVLEDPSVLDGKNPPEVDKYLRCVDVSHEMIDDPRLPFKVARGIVPGTLSDGRAGASEINKQNSGRMLRIPTKEELLMLNALLRDQLEGLEYWIGTETESKDYPGQFVFVDGEDRTTQEYPDKFFLYGGVRFIEDR